MPALPTGDQQTQQQEEQDVDLSLAYESALINNNATEEQTPSKKRVYVLP